MKKRILSLLLSLTAAISFAACSGRSTETKYILTEFETTLSDGTVRKTVNHFDENWIQTGSTVYSDGEVEMEITYELNDRGDLKSVTYTMEDTVVVEEYVSTYDEEGRIIRTDTYTDGEKTASSTIERSYGEDGVLLSTVQTTLTSVYENYYNPDGTLAKTVTTMMDPGVTHTTEFTYDEQGNEIRSVTTGQNGVISSETNSSYDAQGHITISVDTHYNADGSPRETTAAEYLWDGLIKTTRILTAEGTSDHYAVTEYDEAGNMIRHEIYSGGQLMSRQVMTYVPVEIPATGKE